MGFEVEAKMRIADPEAVRQRLHDLGAEQLGQQIIRDQFFDTTEDRLFADDRGLRIRATRPADATGWRTAALTYKGPRAHGQVKQREEIELPVDEPDTAAGLLDRLGYHPRLCYEKHRASWRLGDCRVELDRVPRLGDFVEIEGPDERTVLRARQQLGLAEHTLLRESYPALVAAHLADHGLPPEAMMLDVADG